MADPHKEMTLLIFVTLCGFTVAEFCSDCEDEIGVPCMITKMSSCYDECVADSEFLKPGAVEDVYIENYIQDGQLGFNISFSLPKDASRNSLGGLRVDILLLQTMKRECFCINISKPHCIPVDMQPKLHVDCSIGWSGNSDYSFTIQSLPSSGDNYVQRNHRVGDIIDPDPTDICQWTLQTYTTTVTDNPESGRWEVELEFDTAPKEFEFRKYFFVVVSNGESKNCSFTNFIQDEVTFTDYSLEHTKGKVTFTTEHDGDQCVKVSVTCGEDNWWDCENFKTCLTEIATRFRITIDNSTISPKRTKRHISHQLSWLFALDNNPEPCEDITPLASTTSDYSDTSPSDFETSPDVPLVAVVVPVICIALVITTVVIFVVYKQRRKSIGILEDSSKKPPISHGNQIMHTTGKTVLLVYSNDYKEHQEVIHKFATFLKMCYFNVILDLLDETASDNHFNWMVDSVEKADKVLIIHSEGTYTRYTCQRHHIQPADNKHSPHHDLFDSFVKHFISKYLPSLDWKALGKFVNARFDHNDAQCVINDFMGQASVFVLMDHVADLVAKLHGTTCYSEDFPLKHIDWENYHNYIEGHHLKVASDAAKKYLLQHPRWHAERYGTDSGIGDSIRSGAQPDITNGEYTTAGEYSNSLIHGEQIATPDCECGNEEHLSTLNPDVHIVTTRSDYDIQHVSNSLVGSQPQELLNNPQEPAAQATRSSVDDAQGIYNEMVTPQIDTTLTDRISYNLNFSDLSFEEPGIAGSDSDDEDQDTPELSQAHIDKIREINYSECEDC